jgi:two-component system, NtrC family, sensor histidine kinase HydH
MAWVDSPSLGTAKMRHLLFGRYSGPFIAFGGLLALACLASTWYINRLQSDLARAVRHDVARLEAAEELQICFRQLRLHYFVATADPNETRRMIVEVDRRRVETALAIAHRESESEGDLQLIDTIERRYREYDAGLMADTIPEGRILTSKDLIHWSDGHPVEGLLVPCRELADRQRDQMAQSLERSETQTTWAGRVLLGLGLAGALGGLLAGYATARGLNIRAAHLSVRVRAVQAQLDQEVGEMTLESTQIGDLDIQLDRVIGRVKEVCQRLQDQERGLLRAEQLAAVGHLAAGLAHEIRNPLTGIKFLVEAALRPTNPSPLNAEDLRLIRQEIIRIERTIQGLLDYARTPPPNRQRHDFRDLVTEATGIARGRAEAKPVDLHVEIPSDPLPATVDRDQILSLLTNLLFNAIEAAPPGGHIEIRANAAEGMLRVEVRDGGPGIDPTIADRLFTPFTTTKITGTGLGLTIARRVALDHGGTLSATNRPEGGACFSVLLPTRGTHEALGR